MRPVSEAASLRDGCRATRNSRSGAALSEYRPVASVFEVAILFLIELAPRVVQVPNGILKSAPAVGKCLGEWGPSVQRTIEHLREVLV